MSIASKTASVALDHAIGILKDMPHDGNLVSYGKAGEVVPMCLVDESASTSDMLEPTLQTLLSVYAGYYFRAFTMHNISIGGTSIQHRLDKFSTDRSAGNYISLEEFEQALPGQTGNDSELYEDLEDLINEGNEIEKEALSSLAVATEANVRVSGISAVDKLLGADKEAEGEDGGQRKGQVIDHSLKQADISGPVNFATGMTLNLKISENGNTIIVPVNIRLNAMYIAPSPLVAILGFSAKDISLGARFKKWRLGGIDFWNDLVMCQDLIEEHRKNLKEDRTGIYLRMMNRRRQNSLATALSGVSSANNSSNIVVMTEETASALEVKAGGRLDDYRFRERLFAQGYGIIMAIISQRRGRVRFYTRSINGHTEVSERDMRAASKGSNGPDVGDILNAFRAGSSFRM